MFERLASADRSFIKAQVENGLYTSEIEVIRDAVRRMREEKERHERFRLAVMKGVADIEEGRTTPLTQELMDELMQEGFERSKLGAAYHSNDAISDDE